MYSCFVLSTPTPQSLCNTVSEFSCRIQCVNSDKSQLKVRNNKLGENYRDSLRNTSLDESDVYGVGEFEWIS